MIAPATMGTGTPNPLPTPISATPIVPAVDQEDPVPKETIEQMIRVAKRKIPGVSIFKP